MPAGPTKEWSEHMKAIKNKVEPEFEFHPERMRRVPKGKRHQVSPAETALGNCKVRVTMYLDADVVQHFKQRAAKPDAAPYQTQINSALRRFLTRAAPSGGFSLLQDERFLEAVAERVRPRVR